MLCSLLTSSGIFSRVAKGTVCPPERVLPNELGINVGRYICKLVLNQQLGPTVSLNPSFIFISVPHDLIF